MGATSHLGRAASGHKQASRHVPLPHRERPSKIENPAATPADAADWAAGPPLELREACEALTAHPRRRSASRHASLRSGGVLIFHGVLLAGIALRICAWWQPVAKLQRGRRRAAQLEQ